MQPTASLSVDLDNLWSYLRTHGDAGWESYPSYLPLLVPRLLEFLRQRDLTITVFVVGKDAEAEENQAVLKEIAQAGHEIGNHSFHHEPWLHLYSESRLEADITRAEETIEAATGVAPRGFRGPGFSLSLPTLKVLKRRGYRYDATTLPTFLGPLARAYYFRTARLDRDERERRAILFGNLSDGLRPIKPYRWRIGEEGLVEVPVTTLPVLRTPIHLSYILYLATYSPRLANLYFCLAIRMFRLARVQPSLLLHPLDFLGFDDTDRLGFFPAMQKSSQWKSELLDKYLGEYCRAFRVTTIERHVELTARERRLPEHQPNFRKVDAATLARNEDGQG